MHKNAKQTLNNSIFYHDTPIVACSLHINVIAIQKPSFAGETSFFVLKLDENQVHRTQLMITNHV